MVQGKIMDDSILEEYFDKIGGSPDAERTPPLNLAYIGDCVFELMIRSKIVSEHKAGVKELHKFSRGFAKAAAQSKMYFKLERYLTEAEADILRRGRNAKIKTKAKNASITEYRHATGLEALFGYLFLKGDSKRIIELFQICIEDEESYFGKKEEQ